MDEFRLTKLGPRPIDGHKGTFGMVGIMGGSGGGVGTSGGLSARMIGAPALAAMGANRAGCGLVKIGAPESIISSVLKLAPMATGYPIGVDPHGHTLGDDAVRVFDRLSCEADALVVGPGLGIGSGTDRLVEYMCGTDLPQQLRGIVIDADAISSLAVLMKRRSGVGLNNRSDAGPCWVLTPHPGEARRLIEASGLDADPGGNAPQRSDACRAIADHYRCVVVLKGHQSVVSDGTREWVCGHGHPCLGTGGTGDVLAGMIGGLLAQLEDRQSLGVMNSVCIAVEAHARCGEIWASNQHAQSGLDPRDLGELIPRILEHYRASRV